MIVFNEVLEDLSAVYRLLPGQEVREARLLEQRITLVLLVHQDAAYHGLTRLVLPAGHPDAAFPVRFLTPKSKEL